VLRGRQDQTLSGADEACDGGGGFGELSVGFCSIGAGGVDDAVFQVVVEEAERDALKGGGKRGDLGKDVDAVLLFIDHAVQATGLALDALERGKVAVLVADVAVVGVIGGRNVGGGGHSEILPELVRVVMSMCMIVMTCP